MMPMALWTAPPAGIPHGLLDLHLPAQLLQPRRRHGVRAFRIESAQSSDAAAAEPASARPSAADAAAAAAGPAPAVGWLWGPKTTVTRESLRQQNIRPKK